MSYYWGIDLGTTKIEGAVLPSTDSADPLCRLRIPTEAEQGYQQVLSNIQRLTEMLSSEVGQKPTALGIGTPGAIDSVTGTLKNSNTACLRDQPLHQDLTRLLNIDIVIANDANCFALAETVYGAARGSVCSFGVIMGTGVGGGIIVNNRALNGLQGIAGEWGHNVVEPDGSSCYCGKRGCVETVISGPGLESYYTELSKETRSLNEIEQRARSADDPAARATIKRLREYFGRAIAVVINILDPDTIVLGGGVSNVAALYEDAGSYLAPHVFNTRVDTKIVKHQLGDSAGVFGAALLIEELL